MSDLTDMRPLGWEWSRRFLGLHNNAKDAPVVYMLASGLAGRPAGFKGLMTTLAGRSTAAHVIEFAIPPGQRDVQQIVRHRANVIEDLAAGRPVVGIGSSVGAYLTAYVAEELLHRGVPVISVWADTPFIAENRSFVLTAAHAVRGVFRESDRSGSIKRGLDFYLNHPIESQRASHFCASINDTLPFVNVNRAGVPMLFSHGSRDVLVPGTAVDAIVGACHFSAPITKVALTTAHQEMRLFAPTMKSLATSYADVVNYIATTEGLDSAQRRQAFSGLGAVIMSDATNRAVPGISLIDDSYVSHYSGHSSTQLSASIKPISQCSWSELVSEDQLNRSKDRDVGILFHHKRHHHLSEREFMVRRSVERMLIAAARGGVMPDRIWKDHAARLEAIVQAEYVVEVGRRPPDYLMQTAREAARDDLRPLARSLSLRSLDM